MAKPPALTDKHRPVIRSTRAAVAKRKKFIRYNWDRFLSDVSAGVTRNEALRPYHIDGRTFAKILHEYPEYAVEYRAVLESKVWEGFDFDTIEAIMADVASGGTLKAALAERGLSRSSFYQSILPDPTVAKLYKEAMQLRVDSMADDILDIADDDKNDVDEFGKSNPTAVQRSRLRSDDRKWLMARLAADKYGDRMKPETEITINIDHADRLRDAQTRAVKARAELDKSVVSTQEKK